MFVKKYSLRMSKLSSEDIFGEARGRGVVRRDSVRDLALRLGKCWSVGLSS